MKVLPIWAWLIVAAGVGLLVGGVFVADGSYLQGLMVEIGASSLLVVPIILAERVIVDTITRRLDDLAAIRRASEMEHIDDIIAHWGQALEADRLPPTSREHLGRMLGRDGWRHAKTRAEHDIWTKGDQLLALPDRFPMSRGLVFGVRRIAHWDFEQAVELWNATRPDGTGHFQPNQRT